MNPYFKSKNLAWFLGMFLACYALYICVPGFRPKHMRDIFLGLMNSRGLSLGFNLLFYILLTPACVRLKKQGYIFSIFSGYILFLGFFLSLEIFLVTVFDIPNSIVLWIMRILYIVFFAWGMRTYQDAWLSFRESISKRKSLFSGLKIFEKVLFFLVVFFFFRENMHKFLTRGIPFVPFGDEASWWYPLNLKIFSEGLYGSVRHLGYLPGVPWLATFIPRLLGVSDLEWIIAYPVVVMVGFVILILESAQNRLGLILSTYVLFFTFLYDRDLYHLFAGTLYGDSLATLLTGYLIIFTYKLLSEAKNKKFTSIQFVIGSGFIFAFLALSKAPLSILMYFFILLFCVYLFYKSPQKKYLQYGAVFFTLSTVGNALYKVYLKVYAVQLDNEFSLNKLLHSSIDFRGAFGILAGLLNEHTPQHAYFLGLVASLAILLLLKQYRILWVSMAMLCVQWGFVLGLYATLWQGLDYNSAGRYMAHAAIGVVMSLSLITYKEVS